MEIESPKPAAVAAERTISSRREIPFDDMAMQSFVGVRERTTPLRRLARR
jgi:hypothetical protein